MAENRIGTLGTAPFRINNPDTPQPASFPNEHLGGYHTYDFWSNGTEMSVCGIRKHHRAWNMLAYAADKGITYKLIKGYKSLDIMDNANWKVWRIESEDTAMNKGGLSLWKAEDKPYANEDFVVYDSKIWQSTVADNNFTPAEIDPLTLEPVSAWRESSIDSLAHQRNKDTGGVRAGGVYITFQEIYELILQRVTQSQIDVNIGLGNSDTLVASQKAVKSYVDNLINNALKSPKAFDASIATAFPSGVKGDTYRVTLPGIVENVRLQAGDLFFTDKDVAGAVAADWFVVQSNVDQATTEVLGLLRIATNAEVIAEQVTDKAIVPSALGAWWSDVKTRAGLYFSQVVSFFGINLGTDATAGNTRTIAAKGSENSVSLRLDVKGNGLVGSNALIHAGTDELLASTIEGNLKNTGINPANIVQAVTLGETYYVSQSGDDAKALPGRIDRPYKTISAAIAATPTSYVKWYKVEVVEGTYTEVVSIAAQKSILLFLHSGVTITSADATATINAVLGRNLYILGLGKYSATKIENTGAGNAIRSSVLDAGTYSVFVEGISEISSATGAAIYGNTRGGILLRNMGRVFSTSNIAIHGNFQYNPLYAYDVDQIYSTTNKAIEVSYYSLYRCGKIYSNTNVAIAISYPDSNRSDIVDCGEVFSLTHAAIKAIHRPMGINARRTRFRGQGQVIEAGAAVVNIIDDCEIICESTFTTDSGILYGNSFEVPSVKSRFTRNRIIMGNVAALPIRTYQGGAYTAEVNNTIYNTDVLYDATRLTNTLDFNNMSSPAL
ncbi:hypothetical protein Q0590_25075 [Rhodocytophaga aerolata]|uniref:Right-handed parallel beta-helix repeat-containing protein n=1 Tax=Rhodocytophaga aerolata TaxID=455078 RepID=A0ABT8RE05_9BACT|nr:hypothetical protein [Rhodocytophaga aerolata]MDO1449574.1 hypothetical protein [Rhodocytophaga aerolata]